MELLVFALVVGLLLGAILAAYFLVRPANRQASDLAAGSNKPDDRNAFGPAAEGHSTGLPSKERHAQR